VFAIKRKEHVALSTKIVDVIFERSPKYAPLPESPHLIESSIVEDDKVTVRESVASYSTKSVP